MTEAPLTFDLVRASPDGTFDDSTYSEIEDALDRAEAPMTEGSRWLTLIERIEALAGERDAALARLRVAEAASGPAQEGT